MKLTPEEEEKIIYHYDSVIRNIVKGFIRRGNTCGHATSYNSADDLYQEAAIAVINYLRKCKNEDEMKVIPTREILHAMTIHVVGNQILSLPKRTTGFKEVISRLPVSVSDFSIDIVTTSDSTIDEAETNLFINSLSCAERRIISLKMRKMRNCDIANRLNISSACVTQTIQRVQKKYLDCIS